MKSVSLLSNMASLVRLLCVTFTILIPITYSFTKECMMFGCRQNTITCPDGESCIVECMDKGACEGADVTCPADYHCFVQCTGQDACHGMTLYAHHSTNLMVECSDTASDACHDMSVTCPPNVDGVAKCVISVGEAFGGVDAPGIQFYAENGWKDIRFKDDLLPSQKRMGIMYCNEDFTDSCDIDRDADHWT